MDQSKIIEIAMRYLRWFLPGIYVDVLPGHENKAYVITLEGVPRLVLELDINGIITEAMQYREFLQMRLGRLRGIEKEREKERIRKLTEDELVKRIVFEIVLDFAHGLMAFAKKNNLHMPTFKIAKGMFADGMYRKIFGKDIMLTEPIVNAINKMVDEINDKGALPEKLEKVSFFNSLMENYRTLLVTRREVVFADRVVDLVKRYQDEAMDLAELLENYHNIREKYGIIRNIHPILEMAVDSKSESQLKNLANMLAYYIRTGTEDIVLLSLSILAAVHDKNWDELAEIRDRLANELEEMVQKLKNYANELKEIESEKHRLSRVYKDLLKYGEELLFSKKETLVKYAEFVGKYNFESLLAQKGVEFKEGKYGKRIIKVVGKPPAKPPSRRPPKIKVKSYGQILQEILEAGRKHLSRTRELLMEKAALPFVKELEREGKTDEEIERILREEYNLTVNVEDIRNNMTLLSRISEEELREKIDELSFFTKALDRLIKEAKRGIDIDRFVTMLEKIARHDGGTGLGEPLLKIALELGQKVWVVSAKGGAANVEVVGETLKIYAEAILKGDLPPSMSKDMEQKREVIMRVVNELYKKELRDIREKLKNDLGEQAANETMKKMRKEYERAAHEIRKSEEYRSLSPEQRKEMDRLLDKVVSGEMSPEMAEKNLREQGIPSEKFREKMTMATNNAGHYITEAYDMKFYNRALKEINEALEALDQITKNVSEGSITKEDAIKQIKKIMSKLPSHLQAEVSFLLSRGDLKGIANVDKKMKQYASSMSMKRKALDMIDRAMRSHDPQQAIKELEKIHDKIDDPKLKEAIDRAINRLKRVGRTSRRDIFEEIKKETPEKRKKIMDMALDRAKEEIRITATPDKLKREYFKKHAELLKKVDTVMKTLFPKMKMSLTPEQIRDIVQIQKRTRGRGVGGGAIGHENTRKCHVLGGQGSGIWEDIRQKENNNLRVCGCVRQHVLTCPFSYTLGDQGTREKIPVREMDTVLLRYNALSGSCKGGPACENKQIPASKRVRLLHSRQGNAGNKGRRRDRHLMVRRYGKGARSRRGNGVHRWPDCPVQGNIYR